MRRRKFSRRKKQSVVSIIVNLILILGIGYALIQSNLNINGTANMGAPTWNIHWANVQVKEGSVSASTPTINSAQTTVTYSVVLNVPGDYYEFTVDAVNSGTIDGMIDSITSKLNGATITELPDYLEYTVSYADDVPLAVNQLLAAGTSKKYKVRIKYRDDINLNQIPATNQSLPFQFTVKYKQADISSPEETIITYNANGGTGTMENQTILANSTETLSKNTFTREGYSFKNWNTKADGTGTTYTDEEEVSNLGEITLFAQWKVEPFPYVFRQEGICTFNGSSANITGEDCSKYTNGKYIDTGIKLYSETNKGKDYEIGFTIEEYVPANNTDQATLMNTKYESTGYPGVVFRKQDNTQFELASRKTSSSNENYRFASAGVRDVKIWRINNEIYYKIDDGPKTFLNNLSQYNPTFDLNVWFGATPTNASATTAQRYFTGKLSNMYIKLGTYVENNSYTITFNPNGGEVDPEFIIVSEGDAVGTLPTPTKALHNFVGWYTGLTDGVEVTSTYEPSDDMELFARWQKKPVYTISFDTDGGSSVDDIEIEQGTAIGTLPVPTKANMSFDGWYLESTYNTKVTSSYIPTESITLHAKWSDSTFPKVFEQIGACTFNGSSGTITGENCGDYVGQKYIDTGIALYSETNKNKDYEIGFTINSYTPADNEARATLMNTKLEATGYPGVVFRRNDATDNFVLQSRKTSSANEQKTFAYNTVTSVKVYRISNEIYYSINGGDKVLLNNLTEYNPTFNLTTWFGAAPSNEAGTAAQRYLKGTLSNMYIKLGEYEEAGKFKVTFNPNGGEVTPTSRLITAGESIGNLPIPSSQNGIFEGWYTGLTNGIEIDEDFIITNDIEIFAHWTPYSGNATFLPGEQFNIKLKTLSNPTTTDITANSDDSKIEFIVRYEKVPSQELLTSSEIISTNESEKPVYAWFDDNTIYYYTTARSIYLNADSSSMFKRFRYLQNIQDIDIWDTSQVTNMSSMFAYAGYYGTTWNIGDLSGWNTSQVTNMSYMFKSAGQSAWTWNIGDLSEWDTSKVTDMSYMFEYAGKNATTWNIGDLSEWDTSKVTDMSHMFAYAGTIAPVWNIGDLSEWNTSRVTDMSNMFSGAGENATTFNLNLSGWDTSKVTNMGFMFQFIGCNSTTFNLNLSGWNTSQVTEMSSMFRNAGEDATTFSIIIPRTNGNGINNDTTHMYGKTTSTYDGPPKSRTFTLAAN